MALRDRILTRAGAEAITSPAAILAAGVGAAATIVTGAPVVLAAAVGAAAWVGLVAWRLPRAPRTERIDPGQLGDPWRRFVVEALDARDRFRRTVRGAPAGPVRDRLARIEERMTTGVDECWRVARHGHALDRALRELEPIGQVEQRLARVQAEVASSSPPDARLEQTARSLEAQIASTRRIASVARDTRDRLRLLDARLDEAVARAVELSLRTGDLGQVSGLDSDVDTIVSEMEALRLALDETQVATT